MLGGIFRRLFVLLTLALTAAQPQGASAADVGRPDLASRAVFETAGMETVLVLTDGRLYAFIDAIDDNAPVDVQEMTVASAKRRWTMERAGPGFYRAAVGNAPVGVQQLTVAMRFADRPETVETKTSLEFPKTAANAAPPRNRGWWWKLAAAVVVFGVGIFVWRRMFPPPAPAAVPAV